MSAVTRPSLSTWAWPGLERERARWAVMGMVVGRALDAVDAALHARGVEALVVKGAALGATVYPEAWMRPMSDVDLVVRPEDLLAAQRALKIAGFGADANRDRPLTSHLLDLKFTSPAAFGPEFTVELHLSLDKVVFRPVDLPGIFRRAGSLGQRRALLAPALEDHAVLVILHLAADDFQHKPGFTDLQALLAAGADIDVVTTRARDWGAATAAHVALQGLSHRCPGLIARETLESVAPNAARAALVAAFYDPSKWPILQAPRTLGARWMLRQTVLRDDVGNWLSGVSSYALLRLLEGAWLASRNRAVSSPGS